MDVRVGTKFSLEFEWLGEEVDATLRRGCTVAVHHPTGPRVNFGGAGLL